MAQINSILFCYMSIVPLTTSSSRARTVIPKVRWQPCSQILSYPSLRSERTENEVGKIFYSGSPTGCTIYVTLQAGVFFWHGFLSFTKLLVSKSLAFMACLLPQEKLEEVNKPARRMRDANDSANARFSHAGKKSLLVGFTMFKKTSFLLYCFQWKLGFLARTIPVFAPWLE